MSRRRRAIVFGSAAAVCAGLAAGAAGGEGGGLPSEVGELRPVVVTVRALAARQRIDGRELDGAFVVRRVPERFLPPDALETPAAIAGRAPAVTIPAGSYVQASQFAHAPAERRSRPPSVAAGQRPVEIRVTAAGALAQRSRPGPVDVVVTTEPGPGGRGRTYVAAHAVDLLELRPEAGGAEGDVLPGPELDAWVATLALTRDQALRLIQAESFARSVRLIAL